MWHRIRLAIRYAPQSFALSAIFIAIIAILENLPILRFVRSLLILYGWTAVIYASHIALSRTGPDYLSFVDRVKGAMVQYPRIVLYAAIHIALLVLMFYWQYGLSYLGALWDLSDNFQTLSNVLLVGAPLLLIHLLLLSALPLLVTSKYPFFDCLALSCRRAWGGQLKDIFVFYMAVLFIVYLIVPGTLHSAYLQAQHLKILFDFLVYTISVPVFVNYLLLLNEDLYSQLDSSFRKLV